MPSKNKSSELPPQTLTSTEVPQWIDAHCHLSDVRFYPEIDKIIERAANQGIGFFIQGGVGPEDWVTQIELAQKFAGKIFLCFGLHPWWIAKNTRQECNKALNQLPEYIHKTKELSLPLVGFGELGLDHSAKLDPATFSLQEEFFRAQLQLASQLDLPLVLHIVHAHELAQKILKEHSSHHKGIVHAFSASPEIAQEYVKLGLKISIGGLMVRKGYTKLKETAQFLNPEDLVLETDSPDLPPPSHQNKLNEPTTLREVAESLAKIRKSPAWSASQWLEQSKKNLLEVFKLAP